MQIQQNVSLALHSTMRLGGSARYFAVATTKEEVAELVRWAQAEHLPVLMIGSGSNIVWRDEGFRGLVIMNKITGYEELSESEKTRLINIGAGEEWDKVVERTVDAGLTGIEALSLIPGTAGATPLQNVGAYGQEIATVLVYVSAYDTQTNQWVKLDGEACAFGYRTSRFKTTDRGRFFITDLQLRLQLGNPQPPFYPAVQRYLEEQGYKDTDISPELLRTAVIAIRQSKLPDPRQVANNGSFFANPIIVPEAFRQLQASFPDVVHWEMKDGRVKLSAAWLIEQAGFKDFHDTATGMATWPKQPLVLINEHAQHTADLLTFKQKIVTAVTQKFGVTLEQEPELLPIADQ